MGVGQRDDDVFAKPLARDEAASLNTSATIDHQEVEVDPDEPGQQAARVPEAFEYYSDEVDD